MTSSHDVGRRSGTTALAALPLGATAATLQDSEVARARARTLVTYFSRSGNTRVVARVIHRTRGTELFEIRPAVSYPEDYLATVAQARQESERGYDPALDAKVPGLRRGVPRFSDLG